MYGSIRPELTAFGLACEDSPIDGVALIGKDETERWISNSGPGTLISSDSAAGYSVGVRAGARWRRCYDQ